MANEISAVDIEAFRSLDQRWLLRVLGRAIDKEVAECMNSDHFDDERSPCRVRLRCFCTLVSMIEDMNDRELDSTVALSGRRKQRAL